MYKFNKLAARSSRHSGTRSTDADNIRPTWPEIIFNALRANLVISAFRFF
ncbi:hypothetical protein D3OALGA1CA_4474 [Olavius algarvensis associated proteobacterium Delta 3]|nr:hypothetical protein D3OALGA1CA_4474 [Olavius algarvensis associated proteobacterium Delta 3]